MSLADNDGFDIPFASDDAWTECGLDDPDYGDPAEWPAWTDERWIPTAADSAWLAAHPILPPISGGAPEAFEPTDADWDDLYAASYGGFTDEDLEDAGLPVG